MTNLPSWNTPSVQPLLTRIPFIKARFPDPDYTSSKLSARFNGFWSALREKKVGQKPDTQRPSEAALADMTIAEEWAETLHMPFSVSQRIKRRAIKLAELHKLRSPMAHLREGDLRMLELARRGVDLVRIRSEHDADVIASKVFDEFFWMGPATDALWQAMRLSVRKDEPGFRLPPLLLDGPPGTGKSTWARHVATLIGTPELAIDASGENAGFGIVGVQRGWGTALPGRPVSFILQERVGNPVVIIDEIEKAGSATNMNGQTFSLVNSLLPLLERTTAKGWNCPFFRVPFDMSWISWILTSNYADLLPPPFRSRCTAIEVRDLTVQQLRTFVLREQRRRELSDDVTAGIIGALEQSANFKRRPNLRTVIRMIERAERQDAQPVVH